MKTNKIKLYLLIGGELATGILLLCSAIQTYPVKYAQQVQLDRFKGSISNPANVPSSFAPFLALLGIVATGDSVRRFWGSFDSELGINSSSSQFSNQVEPSTHQPVTQQVSSVTPVKPEQVIPQVTYKPRLITPQTSSVDNQSLAQPRSTPTAAQVSALPPLPVSAPVVAPVRPRRQTQRVKSVATLDINAFAKNKLSCVFAGAPRTGKSTTHLTWMAKKIEADPEVSFRVVTQKKNSFLGLNQIPEVVQIASRNNSYAPVFWQTLYVWNELQARLELEEDERDSLSECWLVLDDWYSIVANLEIYKPSTKVGQAWNICKGQFSDIITLGAEYGVGISANTHTLNLAHFGLAEDSNIRSVLSICVMGRIHTSEGRKEGGFDAITNALRNPYLIDDSYAQYIRERFPELKAYSLETGLPIVLSTMGEPELSVMPDLSWIKNYRVAIDPEATVEYLETLIQQDNQISSEDKNSEDYWQEKQHQNEVIASTGINSDWLLPHASNQATKELDFQEENDETYEFEDEELEDESNG
jgi:hypothetical protein